MKCSIKCEKDEQVKERGDVLSAFHKLLERVPYPDSPPQPRAGAQIAAASGNPTAHRLPSPTPPRR
nr:unnamed protein product [Digitaria exilis]